MCGRYAVGGDIEELNREFDAISTGADGWVENWNIRPTDPVPIVLESTKTGETVRRLELARWSLLPSWSKEPRMKVPTFNARSEDVMTKASYKASVVSKRALIPADGYYEWHTEGKVKTPYFIHPPQGRVAFAGLYSWWRNPTLADDDPARWVLSTTILTMDAVPSLADLHPRNPVVLPEDFWDDWLSPEIDGDQAFVDMAVEAAAPVATALQVRRVAPLRNDATDASLASPISEAPPQRVEPVETPGA